MKRTFTLLIFLCFYFSVKAQEKHLSGTILDQNSHQPIPQSSLMISKKPAGTVSQAGTISNADGKFILLLNDIADTDSLIVTSIGYKRTARLVSALKDDKNTVIYLEPLAVNLHEVVIQPQSIPSILKEAIDFTDSLIPAEDNLNGYYKEFAYLDKELFKYADAAMNYSIENKDKKTKVEMHVIESRVKKDSLTKENKWKSDIESLIKPDKALKDYYSLKYLDKFVQPKQIEKYNYKISFIGAVSKISIDPKEEVHQFLPNAVIYINSDNHRIIKVESVYNTHIRYAPNANLLILAFSFEKYGMSAIYSEGEHPYLRYCKIVQDIRFKVGGKKGLWGSEAELLIHDNKVKLPDGDQPKDAYKKNSIYKNGNKFSADFWYKYNTLLPTAEELKVLKLEEPVH